MWRLAAGVSITELVAALLAVSGSTAPAGAVTVAVLTSTPVAFAAITPVTMNVARSPASSETVVARLPEPERAAQPDPASAVQVQTGATSTTGNRSVTLAPVTGLGPMLVTTIE